MTDNTGNIDDATQAAREGAERVRTAAADGGASFGATAEEIADDLSVKTEAAKNEAAGAVNDITGKVSEVVDSAKSAASEVRAAAADAARSASATIKGAADDLDIDQLITQTRTIAGEWTEKVKQAYRERPSIVIGAAVGVVVLAAAMVRAIGRR